MRVPDWESRLAMAVRKHVKAAPQYGICDCFVICADAVEAVTGKDPYPTARGCYNTPNGALKVLRKHGFNSIEEAWAALFADVPPAQAQRGDILIYDTPDGPAGMPLLTQGAFGRSPASGFPVFLSPLLARRAFRVE